MRHEYIYIYIYIYIYYMHIYIDACKHSFRGTANPSARTGKSQKNMMRLESGNTAGLADGIGQCQKIALHHALVLISPVITIRAPRGSDSKTS